MINKLLRAALLVMSAAPCVRAQNITQPFTGTFWGATAAQDRLADRLFVGPAVEESGLCQLCAPPTAHDWFELLQNNSYNGGAGVYSNGPFTQAYILADPNSATATVAAPAVALTVAAETLNGVTGSTVEAMDISVVNDAVSGAHPGAWGLYLEGHAVGTSTTNTYGAEFEMRNSSGSTHWDPFSTPAVAGSTVGLELGCGAGLPATGQYDCTTGMYFSAVPKPWSTGILFFPGSIDASGPGGTIPAIALTPNQEIQWYTAANTLGGTIGGDAVGGLHIGGTALYVPPLLFVTALAFTSPPYGVPAYYACFTSAFILVVSVTPCP